MASEPIRSKKDVKKIINHYFNLGHWRNYVLIVMGINTALRISDMLRLRWSDVYDFDRKHLRKHLTLLETKTGKRQTIVLNDAVVKALMIYFPYRKETVREAFLFPSNRRGGRELLGPISRQQANRIIKEAARKSRTAEKVSCHSLRKTFGYHAWRAGVQVAVIMEIYNHSSYAVTRRYLGIGQDERDAVYRKVCFGL